MDFDIRSRFNSHLGKKGISGHIKVSYENKTLSIEVSDTAMLKISMTYVSILLHNLIDDFCFRQVKMPQDATSNAVRDTKGLSGAASFST